MRCINTIYEASMCRGRRRQNVIQRIKAIESGCKNVEGALEAENCETRGGHGERQREEKKKKK